MRSVLKGKPDYRHRIILSVSPNAEDHAAVRQRLSRSIWCLYEAECISSGRKILSDHNVGVVVCERQLKDGSWIEMLDVLLEGENPPPLVVAAKSADDKLWSEALNRGAYDVLGKPFYQEDLLRSLNLAWLHWYHRQTEGFATAKSAPVLKAG